MRLLLRTLVLARASSLEKVVRERKKRKRGHHKKRKAKPKRHHPKTHRPSRAASVKPKGGSKKHPKRPPTAASPAGSTNSASSSAPASAPSSSDGQVGSTGTQTVGSGGGSSPGSGSTPGGAGAPVLSSSPTGHPLAGLAVTNEVLWSTDPRVGLDPSSFSDQTAKLQTFANLLTESVAQSERVGYLVPGRYVKSAPINFSCVNGHDCFKLFGRSSKGRALAASVIVDTVDGGSGSYALNITGTAAFAIDGISLVGLQPKPAAGSASWKMRALYLPTYCTLSDFSATGYFSGVTMMGDHMLIEDIDVRGNAYGVEFGPKAVTQGDVILYRGRLGSCSIAAIGVARSGSFAGARFQDIDCSNSPYVIRRYDDGTGANVPNWIDGVDLLNVDTANVGNAVVWNDLDSSGIVGVTFDHGFFGNPGLYGGPVDPGGPQLGAWYSSGPISDVVFLKSLPSSVGSRPGILATSALRVVCDNANGIPQSCAAGQRPFAMIGNQNGSHFGGTACGNDYGYGTLVVPYKTDSTVHAGCCVTPANQYDVVPYAGSGRVVGVAAHDASPTQIVHVVANGIEQSVQNTSSQTILANALLTPDMGGGVAAGHYGAGQIIGRSLAAIAPGATGPAHLHIGANP